ncbi:MAG: RNA polymerase sigma factor [Streptosporangiaceae bacterium]
MEQAEAARLARAAAAGDEGAWAQLVAGYSGLVWSVIRSYRLDRGEAADVFQTAWLRLTEHIGRLDRPEHVGAWLATTARREALRIARQSARTVPTGDDALFDAAGPAASGPEQAVLDSERDAELWQAFNSLPPRCRLLLRLLIADPPPSYAEIAAITGRPVGSLGPTRARCLRLLRGLLAEAGISRPPAASA